LRRASFNVGHDDLLGIDESWARTGDRLDERGDADAPDWSASSMRRVALPFLARFSSLKSA
jgi:hypothetical protein